MKFLILLFSFQVWAASPSPLTAKDLSLPQPAPRFVVMDFWASWCGPCEEAAPFYESQFQKWKDKGVYFVGINQDDSEKSQKEWLAHHQISFPQIFDKEHVLANKLDVDTLPRLLIFDSKLKLIKAFRGFRDEKETKDQMEKAFAELFSTGDTKSIKEKKK